MTKTILRKRVQLTDFPTTITDQDAGQELTMKSIVAKMEKGVMPRMVEGVYLPQPSKLINYQDVHALQQISLDLYNQLPTSVKTAMGNNYSNLEGFINDPKNQELLLKEGILVQKTKEDTNFIKFAQNTSEQLRKLHEAISPQTPPSKQASQGDKPA